MFFFRNVFISQSICSVCSSFAEFIPKPSILWRYRGGNVFLTLLSIVTVGIHLCVCVVRVYLLCTCNLAELISLNNFCLFYWILEDFLYARSHSSNLGASILLTCSWRRWALATKTLQREAFQLWSSVLSVLRHCGGAGSIPGLARWALVQSLAWHSCGMGRYWTAGSVPS